MITGVNLPMLIKLARPQQADDLLTMAREMREHGRNAIWVASDLLRGREERDDLRGDRSSTRSACTRGRRRNSCTSPPASCASVRVAKGGREMDGKSIMGLLLLSAAQGSDMTIIRGRRRRGSRRLPLSADLIDARLRRSRPSTAAQG